MNRNPVDHPWHLIHGPLEVQRCLNYRVLLPQNGPRISCTEWIGLGILSSEVIPEQFSRNRTIWSKTTKWNRPHGGSTRLMSGETLKKYVKVLRYIMVLCQTFKNYEFAPREERCQRLRLEFCLCSFSFHLFHSASEEGPSIQDASEAGVSWCFLLCRPEKS